MTPIASNFDVDLAMGPTAGTGEIPRSAAPDVVGAFRFICRPGPLGYIDPIVNPGPRGTRSHHLHQFFGHTGVQSDSTYASLRKAGGSTCNEIGNASAPDAVALNRSGYWMPAMLDGKGHVVRPDHVAIYYKAVPKAHPIVSDPDHPEYQGRAVDLPHGIRFIFGRDMLDLSKPPTGGFHYACDGPTGIASPNGGGHHFRTLADVAAACPTTPTRVKQGDGSYKDVYNQIGVVGNAPDCWDGKNLDTPNHRDHVTYGDYGGWGYYKCPKTHPYVIPAFTMGAWYTVDANLKTWALSSDAMAPGQPAGSTYHADFFMAWDPLVHRMFHDGCIERLLNCSGGDLGNGKQLNGAGAMPAANPRLVPVPTN